MIITRLVLNRAHTSPKAADPAKFLLLNKLRVKLRVTWGRVIRRDTGTCHGVRLELAEYNVAPTKPYLNLNRKVT